ncbi:MAG: glycosyltransferase family 4 protein, partial [Aliifodinibius sp.]|nr:glycosyltransferase family 4 protein [Fodinibius sp.]NIV16608.1 glycosyltransferase family 4 protein [Fodinibius sp.]NIY30589.1 glycosyltransferase family 4 protein [Fodinibius sp.]
MKLEKLKIALVHDWLTGMRGGEKVLEALGELFCEADLFTLLHNPGSVSDTIERHQIFTSFINRLPFKAKRYRHYLPLFPTAIESFNLKNYDLIISTSHCVAKGVRTPPNVLHISYLHTPMRYVWDLYEEYFGIDKIGA